MIGATKAIPLLESKAAYGSPQTRLWTLGAIEVLGTKSEVPFFAELLQDSNVVVAEFSARAIEHLAQLDFGVPECPPGPCTFPQADLIEKAQEWWKRESVNAPLFTVEP